MRCPKCGSANEQAATECVSCAVQFKDLRASGSPLTVTCAWDDRGAPCPCRGIISIDGGRFYCREHSLQIRGLPFEGRGNYPVTPKKQPNEWDEWTYNPQTRRLERRVDREPGSDDELEDLVSEEASQA